MNFIGATCILALSICLVGCASQPIPHPNDSPDIVEYSKSQENYLINLVRAYNLLQNNDDANFSKELLENPALANLRNIVFPMFSQSTSRVFFYRQYSQLPTSMRNVWIEEIVLMRSDLADLLRREINLNSTNGAVGVSSRATTTARYWPGDLHEFDSLLDWWKSQLVLNEESELSHVSDNVRWADGEPLEGTKVVGHPTALFHRWLPKRPRGILGQPWEYQARYVVRALTTKSGKTFVQLKSEVWRRPNVGSEWAKRPDGGEGSEMSAWFWRALSIQTGLKRDEERLQELKERFPSN